MTVQAIAPAPTRESLKLSRKAAVSSFIGTTIEWYDYFIYGTAAALVFPKVFFDNLDGPIATLASLLTFAVAFVLRPVGGAVFGHFGDTIGRKRMLIITLSGMGICTGLIGCLPSEAAVGVLAPSLLILLRAVQGFALGGEWGGAALMTVEHAPDGKRGLYGSTMQAGVPAGLVLSSGVFALISTLPDDQFYNWGWRIPFLIGFALLVIGLYIRLQVTEPPAFKKIEQAGEKTRKPIVEVFKNEWRKVIVLTFLQSASNVGYFLITVYALTYVTEVLKLPRDWVAGGLVAAAAVDFFMQIFFGWLSDKVGRKVVYFSGSAFLGAFAFVFFQMLNSGDHALIVWALIIGLGLGHASVGSLHGVIYAEQFPARYRYSGASVSYQLSGIVSSAPTPLLAAYLVTTFGSSDLVGWYVVIAAVVSCVCVFFIKETRNSRIDI
jgi:MFS transporter, MHS family, shikimate and dehydroshikimate transport protein